ncbi:HOOK-domain-containing protein [Dentipellis sp. KUC8613]|nr:HOOK-domain-containing protein [Dentipellis sp. KUC8613]
MGDLQRKELDAFFSFFATFDLTRPVTTVSDLGDGAALFEILATIDADYFRQPTRPSPQLSDNWVLRFSALKRVYRLMTQYFSEVLHQPTTALDVPDLQAVAKDHNVASTLLMCRLTIAIAVQCEKNKEFIEKIQGLSETDQHYLMKAIEQVMAKVKTAAAVNAIGESGNTECVLCSGERMAVSCSLFITRDDHYYQIQSERSRVFAQKETLEKVYQSLLDEHRTLQTNYDDAVSEKDEALARAREIQREVETRRNDKADVMMRAEIDRLRSELQKSEDNLAVAESELDKHTNLVTDLTRKVDDLQSRADEAVRLKDQLDEYRHAADRLAKTENVMEKYKKKLQEGADLRQHVKSLEKQNADLVDKNASLEEEYRKVAAFKPLMESYKIQIADLEGKSATRSKEMDTLRFELEQVRTKLRITEEERAKDSETLDLYQERVRELELMSNRPTPSAKAARASEPTGNMEDMTEEELLGKKEAEELDEEGDLDQGLGGELDDALTGTTMTDLKLQVRKLKRELEAVRTNQADLSRVLVLENLLDDANRMKARYEADYLSAHREKLVLQNDLEEIRSGKSLGDGAEAAIALRQRLNETVEQLDTLRREHAELEVRYNSQAKELTIAKSDLNLVNKDQLEILASLRESVNEDKSGLEAEAQRLTDQIKELNDKNKMQLEQINGLLFEKVNLQSEGIGQREKMLQRERDIGDLRVSISGKDMPEDVKQRVLQLHEDNVIVKEQLKTTQEKLLKARAFIKSQDKLFKEEQAKLGLTASQGTYDEAEGSTRKIQDEEIARLKRLLIEAHQRYRKEQELMLSAIHTMGMGNVRDQLGHAQQQGRAQPTSWLGQQRKTVSLRSPYWHTRRLIAFNFTYCIVAGAYTTPMMSHAWTRCPPTVTFVLMTDRDTYSRRIHLTPFASNLHLDVVVFI